MITQIKGKKRALLFPAESDKFVLFLTGFPKYPATSNFIELLVSQNYNVLSPLYSGTFDSFGDFSIDNCIEDVRDWSDFIQKGEYFFGPQKPQQNIKASEILLFSHSFGSYILDLALREYNFERIKKAIFVSPLNNPNEYQNQESLEVAKTTEEMIDRNYPISYRFGDKSEFFDELTGDIVNPMASEKIKSKELKTLVLAGERDEITPKEMAESLAKDYPRSILKIIGGGHSSAIDFAEASKIIKDFIK